MLTDRFAGYVRLVSLTVCVASPPGWEAVRVDAASTPQTGHVSFELDASGLVLVPVALGGLESQRCVLDTGATRTLVSERIQAR
ncbi:MAG: hypothetical protein ACM36C_05580, partial [Acidobacteriota bacterium]